MAATHPPKFKPMADRRSSGSKVAQPVSATLVMAIMAALLTVLITPTLYFEDWSHAEGEIAPHDLHAPFTLTVPDPELRERMRETARASAARVYLMDVSVADRLSRRAHQIMDLAEARLPVDAQSVSPEALAALEQEVLDEFGVILSHDTLQTLGERSPSEQFREEVRRVFHHLLNRRGLEIGDRADTLHALHADGRLQIEFVNGPRPDEFDPVDILNLSEAPTAGFEDYLSQSLLRTRTGREALRELVRVLIVGNVRPDTERTEALSEEALEALDPADYSERYEAGTLIVAGGRLIDRETHLVLSRIEQLRPYYRLLSLASSAVIVVSLLLFLIFHILRYRKDWSYRTASVMVLGLPLVITLFIGRVFLQSMPANPMAPLFYPSAALGMLGVILIGPRIGLLLMLVGALMFGFMTQMSFAPVIVAVVSGAAAVTSLYSLQRRRDILVAGIVAGIAGALTILVIRFAENPAMLDFEGWRHTLDLMGVGLLNGALASSMITLLSLVAFEYLFRITTDLSLIELTSLKTPLMKQMEEKTPGTYQHTLNVAKLAEGAAMAIGANYLLVRAGAHYHDIGKMVKPKYFTENQATAEERRIHQKLVPSLSALIIKEHVKKGIELARMHRLPEKVIDFIPQHHGTSLIKFFHNEAQRRFAMGETSDPVREEDYRYPGPNPQYIETAILMLADSVEATATAKLMGKTVNPADVERLVRDTIREKFNDGQLDECNLTLADLNKIRASFIHTLLARFHQRVDYPAAHPIAAKQA